jgi:hypothetical protein
LYNLPKRKKGEEGMRMREDRVKISTEMLIDVNSSLKRKVFLYLKQKR